MSNREVQQRGFIFRSSQPSITGISVLSNCRETEMQTASRPLEFQTMMSECSLAQVKPMNFPFSLLQLSRFRQGS